MNRFRFLITMFMMLMVSLTGCISEYTASPTPSTVVSRASPFPQSTPQPTTSPTATLKPSPTISPTPIQDVISLDNSDQVHSLARLGKGFAIQSAWSADGKTFAIASTAGIFFYDGLTYTLKNSIYTKSRVSSFALSPDNKTIAIGTCSQRIFAAYWWCNQGKIQIVDANNGSEINSFTAFSSEIRYLKFSKDGKQLIGTGCGKNDPVYGICSGDQIQVWNLENGSLALSFPPQDNFITSIDIAPGGSVFATAREENDIRYWDTSIRNYRAFITTNRMKVSQVAFSPDGKTIAASGLVEAKSPYSSISIWDATTGHLLNDFPEQSPDISALAISPDNKSLIIGFSGRQVMWIDNDETADSVTHGTKIAVFDIASKQIQHMLYPSVHTITHLSFSPNGKVFSAIGSDGIPRVWDIQTGEMVFEGQEYAAALNALAISADGRFVATGGYNGWVYLWAVQTRQLTLSFPAFEGNVTALAFNPDGKTIVAASGSWGNSTVKTFTTDTGQEITGPAPFKQWISDVAFNPNGNSLMVAAMDFSSQYDYPSFKSHMLPAQAYVRFSRDGKTVVMIAADGMMNLYDAQTGKKLFVAKEQIGGTIAIAYDFVHDWLALTAQGDPLMLLSGQNETLIGRMDLGPQSRARAIDFSPDGNLLAAGLEGVSPAFVLINPRTLTRLTTIFEHTEAIEDIRFNRTGNLIATCSQDGTVILWGLSK